MSSINGTNIERMRVNGNEIALAKINGKVVFQKNKLLKTFFGDSKQETTQGYNELEPKMESTTRLGITCTNNGDGTFTLNGIAQYNTDFRINQGTVLGLDNLMSLNGEYTLKSENKLIEGVNINIIQNDTWKSPLKIDSLSNKSSYNFENFNDCFVTVYIYQGTVLNNFTIKPFLYKGTEDKSFEPYTGGQPSPNPDYPQKISSINGVNLKLVGKNLFDINKYVEDDSNYYSLENDNLICEVIDSRTQGFVYTSFEKGTYTVSTTNVCNISIHEENNNYLFIRKQNVNKFTFTLEENKKLHFKFFSSNVPYEIGKVQIEKGYQATNYESYKSQTIPVNLQGNILSKVGDYADELQIYSNGDVKLIKKIREYKMTGNENVSNMHTGNLFDCQLFFNNKPYIVGYGLSNYYKYNPVQSGINPATVHGEFVLQHWSDGIDNNYNLLIKDTNHDNITNFKNHLAELYNAETPVKIYYPLVNSTTTKVDNIKEELNSFGDYSNIEIETTYS